MTLTRSLSASSCPYRCFGNKRLTAHSAHRRQRELLRHLQHVHGVVTAAVSKIRCHGQRADENDSGKHRRNSRSGAWVRSDDTLAGEGKLLHSILVSLGQHLGYQNCTWAYILGPMAALHRARCRRRSIRSGSRTPRPAVAVISNGGRGVRTMLGGQVLRGGHGKGPGKSPPNAATAGKLLHRLRVPHCFPAPITNSIAVVDR